MIVSYPGNSLENCAKNIEQQLEQRGFEPGLYQTTWREWGAFPENEIEYNSQDCMLAILDALIHQGGIAAWCGDGTSCVQQMIELAYKRRDIWRRRAISAEASFNAKQSEIDRWKSDAEFWRNRFLEIGGKPLCKCHYSQQSIKTVTTNSGTVKACEICSRHWFEKYGEEKKDVV